MNRNFGIGFLILCFAFSNVNIGWATETMETSPIIVQPYEIQELNQQIIDRDRQNRDEEIAIKELIEDNDKLTQASLAHQEDEGLAKIDKTMLSYRDALISRDRARIIANGEKGWTSRYGDLIALTEDADAMTVHRDLEDRSGMLTEKYQMLTELKDEMTALNDKLKSKSEGTSNQNEAIIDGLKKTAQDQQDKIQTLVTRLGEMDQKIAHFDEIIAEKDHQISQLKDNLSRAQSESATKDEMINSQKSQIAILQGQGKGNFFSSNNQPPAAPETPAKDQIIQQQKMQLSQKQDQVDLLKSELENKITELKAQGPKVEMGPKVEVLGQQQNQIAALKQEEQELASKNELIKSQADQIAKASEQFKDQSAVYTNVQNQVMALKNRMQQQSVDLKTKDDSIRWLNQVLAASKDKAEYFKLTSQQDQLSMKQVQGQVQNIKDDFARRFKDYDQFESAIVSLKSQVSQLGLQVSQKQQQVDTLKAQLQNKITEKDQIVQNDLQSSRKKQQQVDLLNSKILDLVKQENEQGQQVTKIQQELKDKLQDKEDQITKLKSDIQDILQTQANNEIYHRKAAAAQVDERITLAKQLIGLQQQESALLEEKSGLYEAENENFDRHFSDLESKINGFLANHQFRIIGFQNHMEELKDELSQKEDQVNLLNTELNNKISEEKNQSALAQQIHDLKIQLQDQEDQIASMKKSVQEGQKTQEEADSFKQQLAAEQDKADQLKQQLDSKVSQSDQMTLILGEYQKKLESKDNAYNEELGQVLSSRNDQALMEKQIAYLNDQLQQKEAQVIKIKRDMYDLRASTSAQDTEAQTKDLSLSMIQKKMMDQKIFEFQEKINELQVTNVRQLQEVTSLRNKLALGHQQLEGVPGSDEIEFLRAGLKKAVMELQQKDEMLFRIKANAAEYAKEFKQQTQEFQSLKDQLLDAQHDLKLRGEDLKYKDMAIARLKYLSNKAHESKPEVLQARLRDANLQIKDLQAQLNRLTGSYKEDPLEEKLKQALDKIDEQGRMINILVKKLQDSGQSVDLTKDTGRS